MYQHILFILWSLYDYHYCYNYLNDPNIFFQVFYYELHYIFCLLFSFFLNSHFFFFNKSFYFFFFSIVCVCVCVCVCYNVYQLSKSKHKWPEEKKKNECICACFQEKDFFSWKSGEKALVHCAVKKHGSLISNQKNVLIDRYEQVYIDSLIDMKRCI